VSAIIHSTADALRLLADEYFRLHRIAHKVQNSSLFRYLANQAPTQRRRAVLDALKKDRARWRRELRDLVGQTKLDGPHFLRQLSAALRKGAVENAIEGPLKLLRDRADAITGEAEEIPRSADKALIFIRASIDISPDDIHAVNLCADAISPDHPAVERLLSEIRDLEPGRTPSAALGTEDMQSVGWYIFLSRFGAGEVRAKKVRSEIEVGFRRALQTFASDIHEWREASLLVDVLPAAQLLWLIGSSQELAHVLQLEIVALIEQIAMLQSTNGSWPQSTRDGKADETGEATAMCLLALARVQNRSRYHDNLDRAANWLCGAQRSDGSWSADGRTSSTAASDLLVTATARHALIASLQDVGAHVARAETFLWSRQEPLGSWNQKPWPTAFVTSTVITSLRAEWPDIPPSLTNNYLRAARELLPKAARLLNSADLADCRLGIIALYHGFEALLYGCFVQPHLMIPIWQTKQPAQTIGLREALGAFRDRNAPAGSSGPALRYEQQIRTLASLRDGIVHRSDDVSRTSAMDARRDAAAFVKAHAGDLLPPGLSVSAVWPWI
jgi:Prenyltransferase and squalene oxidase repeat